jgi:hypothetical protein
VPFLESVITSPLGAVLYGMNMGSTWGLKVRRATRRCPVGRCARSFGHWI